MVTVHNALDVPRRCLDATVSSEGPGPVHRGALHGLAARVAVSGREVGISLL